MWYFEYHVEEVECCGALLLLDSLPKWPRILVEVASQDFWDRHRMEGYGYLDLPTRPGQSMHYL